MIRIFLSVLIFLVHASNAAPPATKAKDQPEKKTHGNENKEDNHDHAEEEKPGHDHGKQKGHAHGDSEEGESGNIGPDKGIVEADDHVGFKLSPEAFKNFDLKFVNVSRSGPVVLPPSAIVVAGEEVNIFRMRNNFFKRIDFQLVRKSEKELVVTSKDLSPGDQVAVAGLGFLRIAELAAFGGVASGHSH